MPSSGARWQCIVGVAIVVLIVACARDTDMRTPTAMALASPVASHSPRTIALPSPIPTPSPTLTLTPSPTPTSSPVPTPTPTPDPRHLAVAFVSDLSGNDDVYMLDVNTGRVVNLTSSPAEERDPAFSPDGHALFFRANDGKGWSFYRLDLTTGKRTPFYRADHPPAYRGHLTWDRRSGRRCAYESYRDGNLELYLCADPGRERRLTHHPAGDYEPAWRPGGTQIAFTSWRGGNKDIYLLDASTGEVRPLVVGPGDETSPAWAPDGRRLAFVRQQGDNADVWELTLPEGRLERVTGDPYPDRSPTYAPDGTLYWTRYVPGEPFEVHDPYRPGRWRLWMRDVNGREREVPMLPVLSVRSPAAALALWPSYAIPLRPPTPTPIPTPSGLVTMDVRCAGNYPRLNALVADSYRAWRAEVKARTGYDFMGTVSDMFRPAGYSKSRYGHLSWHRAGRAVDLLFEWHDPPDADNGLVVVREDLGAQTYWRLYLRTRRQDGTMGEPLTSAPWVFWFSLDRSREPAAVAAGGRPGEIPAGYYVDLTRLAARHGWHRIAAYEEPDFDWRTDSLGREFWHYQRADGLTWWQAMRQLYPEETLKRLYGWQVCTTRLHLPPSWLRAKGVPTPAP